MNPRPDTIAAIATPPGVGGIAIIRLAGPDALAIAGRHIAALTPATRYARYRLADGSLLDEVVVSCFPEGHSYTGDSVVEIACHGSRYVQQALLQSLLDDGARLAEPGEFTRRAFLSGRLNLSQAEAVADLIDATTPAAHALAISQLRGGYAQRLQQLRAQLIDLAALLELELDFSDEEVEFADRPRLLALTDAAAAECRRLADSFQWGNAVKNGVPVAIVGAPNVGKSTLLNALVGDQRAIVSDIPGTTRDTIEDCVTLGGILFRFIDTAGIRQHTADAVEAEGVRRSLRALSKARIVLLLSDGVQPPVEVCPDPDAILLQVVTKADLNVPGSPCHTSDGAIVISARTGEGLDSLKQRLVAAALPHADALASQSALVTNLRHYQALRQVVEALGQVHNGLEEWLPADLVVVDLREALYHLGTITGEVTSTELLATIFSRFCIGK